MASTDINVLIKLKDEISAEIKKAEGNVKSSTQSMSKGVEGLGGSFGKMAGAMSVGTLAADLAKAAFNGLKTAIIEGAKDADNEALAILRLKASLGAGADAIEKWSLAQQKATRFSQDDTLAAANSLSIHKLNREEILKLLPVIEDFATKKGVSATETANAFGKAIEYGTTRGLQQFGITVDKTGSQLSIFNTLVDAGQGSIRGLAEQAGNLGQGPLIRMKASIDELKESLGTVLTSAMTPFAKFIDDNILPSLQKWIDKTFELTDQAKLEALNKNITRIQEQMKGGMGITVASPYGGIIQSSNQGTGDLQKELEKAQAEQKALQRKMGIVPEGVGGFWRSGSQYTPPSGLGTTPTGAGKGGVPQYEKSRSSIWAEPSESEWARELASRKAGGFEPQMLPGENTPAEIQARLDAKKKSLAEMAKLQEEYESPEGRIRKGADEQIKQVQTAAKDPNVISAQNADKLIRKIEKKRDDDIKKEKAQAFAEQAQLYGAMANKVVQIANNMAQVQLNNIENQKTAEIDAVEHSNMSASAKQKKIEEINKQAAAKEREVKKEQQKWSIAQAIISGAVAIVQGYAQLGPIVGSIMAVLTAAVTASEIAVIASQKFERGLEAGIVKGSGGTDSAIIRATPGEVVATPEQLLAIARGSTTTSNRSAQHYDLSINITGNASQSTVNQIRQSQLDQVRTLKRTMQQAQRLRQAA